MAQTGSTGRFRVGSLLMKSGVEIFTGAGTPTNGGSGTGANKAGPGSLYIDTTNKKLYQNTNTLASPTWLSLGDITAGEITLAAGSVLAGTKTTGVASAVDISAAGAIIVGQGAGETPAAKTLSSDVTMAATGAVTIANNAVTTAKILDANVTNAKLAGGAGLGAVVTAGLGNSAAYPATTDGAQTLVAANATKDRGVLVIAVVDATFADAGGNQPTFQVGETGTAAKALDTAAFTNKAAGTIITTGFLNTATKAIIVTAAKAVGAGTGAVSITALALPNS